MIKVEVTPGNCGHPTTIWLRNKDQMEVEVKLDSECGYIDSMSEELSNVDAYNECFRTREFSKVMNIARKHCKHAGCPVPMAICQGLEVATGVSNTKKIEVKISRE
ncbi:MAG: DUF6951 family protein [Cyclobacteriaceae bacterium]